MGNYDCCQFGELSLRTVAGLRFVQSIQAIIEPGKQIEWRHVVSLFAAQNIGTKLSLLRLLEMRKYLQLIPLGDEAMSDRG